MKNKYNIELFRYPDEAYIIEYNTGCKILKILEKKEQNVEGSVKREYELVLENDFKIFYGFCVNDFLKKKLISTKQKYIILNIIFSENNINVLFGDDNDYFNTLDNWIDNL